ncbi:hypothetical protein PAPYR_5221 [Paratrimastix pyriformis]|uniref:Uncharacterized protein n=1 Tax=Paratrimastix pyriformis TaxID=342808 RepID=A0ABQ8UI81_9EUKA|nr:hypothetical protein PAPYR_5221 [Paratrimastix pyriformis]
MASEAKEYIQQVLKRWDLRGYVFCLRVKQVLPTSVIVEAIFSKPTQQQPIPDTTASIVFTYTPPSGGGAPMMTFHLEHQTFEHVIDHAFVFNPEWIDKIVNNKRKIRQDFSSLAVHTGGLGQAAPVLRNLQVHTTLATPTDSLNALSVSHIFSMHDGLCALCEPEQSSAPAALAALRTITLYDLNSEGRSSARRPTTLTLDLGQPQPQAQIFVRLTNPGKLVVTTVFGGTSLRVHLFNTGNMRKQCTIKVPTGVSTGQIVIRSVALLDNLLFVLFRPDHRVQHAHRLLWARLDLDQGLLSDQQQAEIVVDAAPDRIHAFDAPPCAGCEPDRIDLLQGAGRLADREANPEDIIVVFHQRPLAIGGTLPPAASASPPPGGSRALSRQGVPSLQPIAAAVSGGGTAAAPATTRLMFVEARTGKVLDQLAVTGEANPTLSSLLLDKYLASAVLPTSRLSGGMAPFILESPETDLTVTSLVLYTPFCISCSTPTLALRASAANPPAATVVRVWNLATHQPMLDMALADQALTLGLPPALPPHDPRRGSPNHIGGGLRLLAGVAPSLGAVSRPSTATSGSADRGLLALGLFEQGLLCGWDLQPYAPRVTASTEEGATTGHPAYFIPPAEITPRNLTGGVFLPVSAEGPEDPADGGSSSESLVFLPDGTFRLHRVAAARSGGGATTPTTPTSPEGDITFNGTTAGSRVEWGLEGTYQCRLRKTPPPEGATHESLWEVALLANVHLHWPAPKAATDASAAAEEEELVREPIRLPLVMQVGSGGLQQPLVLRSEGFAVGLVPPGREEDDKAESKVARGPRLFAGPVVRPPEGQQE